MPQAWNSKIPLANSEYELPHHRRHIYQDDGKQGQGDIASSSQLTLEQRRGVLPFPWGWQLAGLIAAVISGLLLVVGYIHYQAPPFILLVGLGILGLSVYSAMKTNWLREVSTKPLSVKIGAGTSVICGLVPIAAGLLGVAIVGVMLAALFAVLGGSGGK